ncbi:MAG TPA: CUAEP/CCAEP-tail radical SAM protein, partial [Kofleriaceae bacterium]|nr:CUAEP/CCAEP-tail radical SAM protein [Kofleriaceae bacterium]
MNLLLVSCYELGHVPHGLAMAGAFLERAGFAPVYRDLAVERLADGDIDGADLVVISVPMHTALRLGLSLAHRIRA